MRATSFFRSMRLLLVALAFCGQALAQTDPLPSWNDGAAKKAIVDFMLATTTQGSPDFVVPGEEHGASHGTKDIP